MGTGKPFHEVVYCFTDAAVIGVRFANLDDPKVKEAQGLDPNQPGTARPVALNPNGDYVMQPDDKILVLAEDNDTYQFGKSNNPVKTPVPNFRLPPPAPEKILLCGWRRDFDDLITELNKWVPKGSTLTLFNGFSEEKMKMMLENGGLGDLENIHQIEYLTGDPCSGKQLERLGPKKSPDEPDDRVKNSAYRVEEYNSILMLSEEGKDAGMSADSRVMVSMLVMRHIQESREVKNRILVTEIRDPRTQELMSLTKCSDSVVGNELVAMILAQISEDRDIGYVMEDLFSEEGMEMHIKDIRLFVAPDELLNWWDLITRCRQRNMLPIGWIRSCERDEDGEKIAVLNPEDKHTAMRWNGTEGDDLDYLIVISED